MTSGEQTLFHVAGILERLGLSWWLDQGTLLGLVRDGALLPWDSDIDLGVWSSDIERTRPVLVREMRREYNVTVRDEKIKAEPRDSEGLSIDLQIYRIEGEQAWTTLPVRRRRNFLLRKLRKPLSRRLDAIKDRVNNRLAHRRVPDEDREAPFDWLERLDHRISVLRTWIKTEPVLLSVDARYYLEREWIDVQGRRLPVPGRTEEYLAMKYGEDWRIPRRDWKYWRDDGAVQR